MLIEPLESITVKLPGGVRTLEQGKAYNLPTPQAEKLLAKAPDKVRVFKPNWESAWRDLAQSTNGLIKTDPRFKRIMNLLNLGDLAFERDDWNTFCRINDQVKEILNP